LKLFPLYEGKNMPKEYTVVIEKDKEGYFVGTVPQLRGCHSQAKSLDKLMVRMKEAVQLCLEVEGESGDTNLQFIGVQRLAV
jgi:predicted RNase H-like HicB family nuclease